MTAQQNESVASSAQTTSSSNDAVLQAQTTDENPTTVRRSQRRQILLEKKELVEADLAGDDEAPPLYGDIYGEIDGERNGLGTAANVTNDGRVDIRVNQLNRRLSQVFIPALRQQTQNIEPDPTPPIPYIPESLGGRGGVPPPSLSIVIHVVGSRGDVQPFVALGKVLKNTYGHRVRLATHPIFKTFVEENGLEFFSIGCDPSRLMAFMVKNPSLMPKARSIVKGVVSERKKDVSEYIQGCWRSCYEAGNGMDDNNAPDGTLNNDSNPDADQRSSPFVADCIIANPPSFAHVHCAERLGVPLHIMFTMPYSPTQAFPHPLANIQPSNADPQLTNYMSYAMIEVLSWQGLGEIINRFRAKCLGLDPVSLIWAPGILDRLKIPHTYFWSPALIPKPKDWGSHISISGFGFLDLASTYTPSIELKTFLEAGPPPIYIGFGSIVLENPEAMTKLIFAAVELTGQRCLLSEGWGGIGRDTTIPENIFILGNVPHDWLFKHVSCVVHHGGAGTTAAGIAAGRPTLIVPFFGDQPFWGAMVAHAGAGPKPIPHRALTSQNLADAIDFCVRPETIARAQHLASMIAKENGSQTAAQSFHQFLEVDRLRCTLIPSRTAVWRVRKTKVRLSSFAACTLANAKLLDFQDLKLFRAQEYETDKGPWDPMTGFGSAVFGALSSMALGIADIPTETWRAVQMPFESDRQRISSSQSKSSQSKSSQKLAASKAGSTDVLSEPTSQTSLGSTNATQMPLASHISSGESTSILDNAGHEGARAHHGSRSKESRGKTEQKPIPRTDMLRQRNVHTSKGLGRIVKAGLQSPIDLSMGITKGFHNMPRMWGDDTVRPQEKVSDLKTGFTAVGKEFGFGFYDGLTGVVTQPIRGAQKAGAAGFFKGVGKGLGGVVVKPGAALFGIPSHFMKGVHKELQKLYHRDVQSYVVATRTTQGYEEWLQSTDAEKKEVIDRWQVIQKYIKGKHKAEDMMQDMLERHSLTSISQETTREPSLQSIVNPGPPNVVSVNNDRSLDSLPVELPGSSTRDSIIFSEPTMGAELDGEAVKHGGAQADLAGSAISDMKESMSLEDQDVHAAVLASETELQHYVAEAQLFEIQLRQALAQSLKDQSWNSSDEQQNLGKGEGNDDDSGCHHIGDERRQVTMHDDTAVEASNKGLDTFRDPQHLAGTTRQEFEAQQDNGREKTAEERTEEDIVLNYIKKQSLLELDHRSRLGGSSHESHCR